MGACAANTRVKVSSLVFVIQDHAQLECMEMRQEMTLKTEAKKAQVNPGGAKPFAQNTISCLKPRVLQF